MHGESWSAWIPRLAFSLAEPYQDCISASQTRMLKSVLRMLTPDC